MNELKEPWPDLNIQVPNEASSSHMKMPPYNLHSDELMKLLGLDDGRLD